MVCLCISNKCIDHLDFYIKKSFSIENICFDSFIDFFNNISLLSNTVSKRYRAEISSIKKSYYKMCENKEVLSNEYKFYFLKDIALKDIDLSSYLKDLRFFKNGNFWTIDKEFISYLLDSGKE